MRICFNEFLIRVIIRCIIFYSAVLITPSGVVFKEKYPCYPLNPCSKKEFLGADSYKKSVEKNDAFSKREVRGE